MPLVRIALAKGKSPAHIRAVADGVHRALHETYNVPADDRFQLIEQLDPDALIVDRDYLGIHRSDDVVIIHVTASRTRDAATKAEFYRRTAEILSVAPGLRPEDVMIVLTGNEREDWSFGLGRQSYAQKG